MRAVESAWGWALEDELQKRIGDVVERYSKTLFRLPSGRRLLSYVLAVSSASGLAFSLPLSRWDIAAYLSSSAFFPASAVFSWLLSSILMRGDPVLDRRRCLGLEMFSLAALAPPSAIGGLLSASVGGWPSTALRLASVGASLSISARALTLASASLAGKASSLACVAVGPAIWLAASVCAVGVAGFPPRAIDIAFAVLALSVGSMATCSFLRSVRAIGIRLFGTSSFRLIRAFTASWTVDYNGPLEAFLDEIGTTADVRSSILLFEDAEAGEPLGAIVVPGVHPGPFRCVGSSPLPGLVKEALEREMGCPVAVLHGVSGHELNLTSREQREKLISSLLSSLHRLKGPYATATGFIRADVDGARASCQLLGPIALVTLTASPETMEDLPLELEGILNEEATSLGLDGAIVVDAHNCIDGPFDRPKALERFSAAGSRAIKEASEAPRHPFRVGFGGVTPHGFSLDDGMGPGGIVAMAIEVAGSMWAYVVIDGNNMVRGLRERLLAEAEALGFSDGEVTTTDTHIVNARVLVERGYRPVGEAVDWDMLAEHVGGALREALVAMRPSRLRWDVAETRGLKVFGAEQLDRLCELPLSSIRAVKRMATYILGPAQLFLLVLALLL